MEHIRAQLASVSTTLDELIATITSLATQTLPVPETQVAHDQTSLPSQNEHLRFELYEIERSLRAAARRLNKTLR